MRGPYLHLQFAIKELKKLAKNCRKGRWHCIYTDQCGQSEYQFEIESEIEESVSDPVTAIYTLTGGRNYKSIQLHSGLK